MSFFSLTWHDDTKEWLSARHAYQSWWTIEMLKNKHIKQFSHFINYTKALKGDFKPEVEKEIVVVGQSGKQWTNGAGNEIFDRMQFFRILEHTQENVKSGSVNKANWKKRNWTCLVLIEQSLPDSDFSFLL